MVDRPRPPRKPSSSDDDDQPDYELDAQAQSGPGGSGKLPPPDAIPRTLDELWQEAQLEQSRVERRYSLRDLFLVTTIASGALAAKQLLRWDGTAAVLGFCVLLGLLTLVIEPTPSRGARLVWYTLLVLYIIFSTLAVVA